MNRIKLAGFLAQIKILMWKMLIILRRNVIGTVLEICCPYLFISFLLLIRYFIERFKLKTFSYVPVNILTFNMMATDQNRNLILYYPNNEFVRKLVNDAATLLSKINSNFSPIGKFFFNLAKF